MQAQPALSRRDLETRLIEKAWKDPEFKKQVVADPKRMLEKYLGRNLPPNLTITVHEEDPHTLHFSLPPAPSNLSELADEDLEKVSGGTDLAVFTIGIVLGSIVGTAAGTAAGATVAQHGW
jgi:hypothetical protein